MRRYDIVQVDERRIVELTCSICGKDLMTDELEAQEAFHFHQVGGYSSVFGDGVEVYVDICQHCFKEKLGEYCTVGEELSSVKLPDGNEGKVVKIISNCLCCSAGDVQPTSHLVDDLEADSLDLVELVMAFEEEFDCDITDELAEKLVTVQGILDYIESNKLGE